MNPEQIAKVLSSFDVYLKSNRVMPDTIKTYTPIAKKFLTSVAGDVLDEEAFRVYQANNYSAANNTARKTHYALSALYKSQNIPIHIEAPAKEFEPKRKTINPGDMERLIIAIKAGGDSTERGLLALSSTYGLRRKELRYMVREDLDYDNRTIKVRTAKHGRGRIHLIPDCIFDFISNYDFKLRSDMEYHNIFWGMVKQAGIKLEAGFGWHSIRRALYTGFVTNGVDWYLRYEFMRWRLMGGFGDGGMDNIYTRITPGEIDKMVFEKHPFLKWWM